MWMQSSVSSSTFLQSCVSGWAATVTEAPLHLPLPPKRVSRLSCQSCVNDLRSYYRGSRLFTVVVLSGVSLSGWVDTEPNKEADRKAEDVGRQTDIQLRRNTLKHRKSKGRIPNTSSARRQQTASHICR